MAYVLLVNSDNTISTTNRERIMQRSKLVDDLWFLVPQKYKGYDMSDFTVMLEYILPCSRKYVTEILTLDDEMYEDALRYKLPIDTCLSSEPGDIEIQLTFALAEIDSDGKTIQRVRKTSTNVITIVPIAAWSDIIPDSALSALDQRIIKVDAQLKELEEVSAVLNDSKADNIKYNAIDGGLQLTANGKEIGTKVTIKSCDCDPEEGVPIVDIDDASGIIDTDDNDIVEF